MSKAQRARTVEEKKFFTGHSHPPPQLLNGTHLRFFTASDGAFYLQVEEDRNCVIGYDMEQGELFAADATEDELQFQIPGFRLVRGYIDPETERQLLAHIDAEPWENIYRRRVQHFGLGYGSGRKQTVWVRDFPGWLLPLAHRVAEDAPFDRFPENCVINEYIPPQGIAPHRDYSDFGPTVACVSLGSDIVMNFAHPERGERIAVYVPVRSFWVITNEARWEWTHGIAPRLADMIRGERRLRARRVSVTFRTAKEPI